MKALLVARCLKREQQWRATTRSPLIAEGRRVRAFQHSSPPGHLAESLGTRSSDFELQKFNAERCGVGRGGLPQAWRFGATFYRWMKQFAGGGVLEVLRP